MCRDQCGAHVAPLADLPGEPSAGMPEHSCDKIRWECVKWYPWEFIAFLVGPCPQLNKSAVKPTVFLDLHTGSIECLAPDALVDPALQMEIGIGADAHIFICGMELGSPAMPSIGSAGHSLGGCRPCAAYGKNKYGRSTEKCCESGAACRFCHLCVSIAPREPSPATLRHKPFKPVRASSRRKKKTTLPDVQPEETGQRSFGRSGPRVCVQANGECLLGELLESVDCRALVLISSGDVADSTADDTRWFHWDQVTCLYERQDKQSANSEALGSLAGWELQEGALPADVRMHARRSHIKARPSKAWDIRNGRINGAPSILTKEKLVQLERTAPDPLDDWYCSAPRGDDPVREELQTDLNNEGVRRSPTPGADNDCSCSNSVEVAGAIAGTPKAGGRQALSHARSLPPALAPSVGWQRFADPASGRRWWWHEASGRHFFEDSGDWQRFEDGSGKYWWCQAASCDWFVEP